MADGPNCPVCGKPAADRPSPFCSKRCADVDLGRWLTGAYRVPEVPSELDEDLLPDPPEAA